MRFVLKKIQFIHPRRCKPNYRFSVVLVALICLHLQKVSSSVYLSSPWLTSAVQSTTNNGLVHFLAIVKSLIIYHLLIVRKQCYCSTQSAGIYSLSMTPFIYCEYLKTFFFYKDSNGIRTWCVVLNPKSRHKSTILLKFLHIRKWVLFQNPSVHYRLNLKSDYSLLQPYRLYNPLTKTKRQRNKVRAI